MKKLLKRSKDIQAIEHKTSIEDESLSKDNKIGPRFFFKKKRKDKKEDNYNKKKTEEEEDQTLDDKEEESSADNDEILAVWKENSMEKEELTRVKQMFRIPESKEFVTYTPCLLTAFTQQQQTIQKQGTLCIFQGYLCFFEYLPSSLVWH